MNILGIILRAVYYRLGNLYFNRFVMPRRRAKLRCKCLGRAMLGKNVHSAGMGRLVCGDRCHIQDNTSFCFNPIGGNTPEIRIGNGSNIGKYNDFGCSLLIAIDSDVITAPFVHFTDRNHCYEDVDVPIMHQPSSVKGPIRIGSGSWLGFGVQIMSGVTIGKHCIVAAGSIVTRDIPDFSVAAGNPARVIKRYNSKTKNWEKQ